MLLLRFFSSDVLYNILSCWRETLPFKISHETPYNFFCGAHPPFSSHPDQFVSSLFKMSPARRNSQPKRRLPFLDASHHQFIPVSSCFHFVVYSSHNGNDGSGIGPGHRQRRLRLGPNDLHRHRFDGQISPSTKSSKPSDPSTSARQQQHPGRQNRREIDQSSPSKRPGHESRHSHQRPFR